MNSKVESGRNLRGTSLILVAKIWFVVASYGIAAGLSRLLGVAGYGNYGLIVAAVTVINMCFIKGTLQAVSKFVSENPAHGPAILKRALLIQVWMGGATFLLFFLLAPLIARLLKSPGLTPYLRIASLIILFYSFYSIFIGVLNGQRRFTVQATLDISYSTLKLALLLILAYFFSLRGAIWGFALAAGIVMAGSALVVGWRRPEGDFPAKKLIAFFLPVMSLTFVIHLVMHLDLFFLKALAVTGGISPAIYAGWYTADLTFARLPFMIVVSAFSLVIFPFVSRSTFDADRESTARYIRQGMRLTYLLTMLGTVLIASSPEATLRLIYGPAYAPGAVPLAWICGGYLFFSLFMMILIVISSSGHPLHSLLITIGVFLIQATALYILVPRYTILGAAWGSSLAFLAGMVIGGYYLIRRLGAFLEMKTFLRITGAGGIVFALSRLLPAGGLLLLVKDILLAVLFILILLVLKEVRKKDWKMLLATLPARKRI